jgi:hypothetical protein
VLTAEVTWTPLPLKTNEVSEDKLVRLAAALGESLRDNILTDALNVSNLYKDGGSLENFETEIWISERNAVSSASSASCGLLQIAMVTLSHSETFMWQ